MAFFGTSKATQTSLDCPWVSLRLGLSQGFALLPGMRFVCLPVSPPTMISVPLGSGSTNLLAPMLVTVRSKPISLRPGGRLKPLNGPRTP